MARVEKLHCASYKMIYIVIISYFSLISFVSGGGLKHMRAHGKEDNTQKVQSSDIERSDVRAIHQLRNMTIEGAHIDGLPIFVKFHKTGSATASTIFRKHCHYSMKLPGLDGMFPWKGGPICGPLPHEHASINLYRAEGISGFERCSFHKSKIQLYTVLRTPVERFFSGVYFWKRELEKHNLQEIQSRLQDPSSLTVEDIDKLALALHWYGKDTMPGQCSKGRCFSARPGPLLQFTSVLGKVDVNDPVARDTPSSQIVEAACDNLKKDYRVGISEEMDSFAVLVALDNGWPLDTMCIESHHFNKDRPRGSQLMQSLKPEVRAHLDKILAPDNAVYACAKAQHRQHLKDHTINGVPMHTIALNHFQSAMFQTECDTKAKEYQIALGARRKENALNGQKKFNGDAEWVIQRRGLKERKSDAEFDILDGNKCIMTRPKTEY